MKLKNILIVVKDIEKAKQFYHDLFGLDVVLKQDGNVILTEGLVLQDEKIWTSFLGKKITSKHNSSELYFEEKDIKSFIEALIDGMKHYRSTSKNQMPRLLIEVVYNNNKLDGELDYIDILKVKMKHWRWNNEKKIFNNSITINSISSM